MYRKNQYSIDDSEQYFQGKKVAYIGRYLKSGDFSYKNAEGYTHYGIFIDNFQSYRKLQAIVEPAGNYEIGNEIGLKIYNPYSRDVPLENIRFGISYLNAYKQVQETLPIEVRDQPDEQILKARDTTYFTFTRPVPKNSDPTFLKITLSENGLYWGLNGNNVKIK